jgi:hypothetical protein
MCLAVVAVLLWLASFFLPATWNGREWMIGYQIAAIGYYGPIIGQFGWYANLFIVPALGVLALGDPREDRAAISRLCLALSLLWFNTLFFTHLEFDSGRQNILAYGVGYYAWMAAVLIAWAGLLHLWWRGRPESWREDSGDAPEEGVERGGGAMLEDRP